MSLRPKRSVSFDDFVRTFSHNRAFLARVCKGTLRVWAEDHIFPTMMMIVARAWRWSLDWICDETGAGICEVREDGASNRGTWDGCTFNELQHGLWVNWGTQLLQLLSNPCHLKDLQEKGKERKTDWIWTRYHWWSAHNAWDHTATTKCAEREITSTAGPRFNRRGCNRQRGTKDTTHPQGWPPSFPLVQALL